MTHSWTIIWPLVHGDARRRRPLGELTGCAHTEQEVGAHIQNKRRRPLDELTGCAHTEQEASHIEYRASSSKENVKLFVGLAYNTRFFVYICKNKGLSLNFFIPRQQENTS